MLNFKDIVSQIDPDKSYTIPKVVEMVGVSYTAILNAVKRGDVESKKIFGRHWIEGKSIRDYLSTNKKLDKD